MRLVIVLCAAIFLASCGSMAPMPDVALEQSQAPRTGRWSLEYSGGCTGREAEPLDIKTLDESAIVFDDFQLWRDESGQYAGSAVFIAPMPVDGREIPYEITYRLRPTDAGGFVGTETITEGGGHSLDCPVELIYAGET